jgi:4-amino-4-deoxy-L-arabinose transferase-like glycosyltransferase
VLSKGKALLFWDGTVRGKSILQRVAIFFLISVILIAGCLRLVHLGADFPGGLNWSSDLYTDEGWYSGNAVAWALTGHWYIPGDFNSIITLPFFQWIQMGFFGLLGVSLVSARISVAFFSILALILAFLVARRYGGDLAGWITLGLLSTDYAFFAYSRIALLEVPLVALSLGSIWLAGAPNLPAWLGLGLGSLLLAAAVLTKTSALPFLLVVICAVWLRLPGTGILPVVEWKKRLGHSAAFLAGFVLILGGETFFALHRFEGEFVYLTTTNVALAAPTSLPAVVYAFLRIFLNGFRLDPLLVTASLGLVVTVWISHKGAYLNRLVVLASLWIGVYGVYLGLRSYLPPRYYVPLIVAMTILVAGCIVTLIEKFSLNRRAWLSLSLVAIVGLVNLAQIIHYMSRPQYTFRNMGVDISNRIRETAIRQPVYIVGNLADSVSLVTGYPAINTQLGFKDLSWRLATYNPQFYVSLGLNSRELRLLSKQYRVEEMASYQVFGNYYHNKSVYLFQLTDLPNPPIEKR